MKGNARRTSVSFPAFLLRIRISAGQVVPLGPTPTGVLELSVIDRIPVLRCNVRTLHVFRHGPGAAQVIRTALSKALVHYYPLAGRLHVSDQNELQIACSGEGIWFVEASTDCTLDAVNCFDDAVSIPYDKLLPTPHEQDGLDPLVQMQVTQFGCKGFVIGLIFCHSICDGLGAAQFLNAVGEMARGAEKLSITPEWRRDFLPPTASATPPPPPSIQIPDYQLEHATIDISLDRIKDLKQEYQEWSGGDSCSTFEIVAAMLWRQRTLAINPKDETDMNLVFFANCRQLVEPPLPKGFYGNCFFPVTVTVSSETLTKKSKNVFQVVKLIQQAKTGLPNQFSKWINNNYGAGPFSPPLGYATLFISEWARLGFGEVDYGWGRPAHIIPVHGSSIIPVGIVSSPPGPKREVRMMTWCVQQTHIQQLTHHMQQ